MNLVFHSLLGLLLLKLFGISNLPEVLVGFAFAVFPDLDHFPHLKKAFKSGRFGAQSRSTIHELTGIIVVVVAALIVNLVYPSLFFAALACGLSHFVVDFLTRPFRPLYPFSDKEVHLNLYPTELRKMFICDTILTAALGTIYMITALV